MLESKLGRQFEYSLDINPSRLLKKFVNECANDATYLLHPEDTSAKTSDISHDILNQKANSTRDVTKTLFWITVSIAATIALGQLH